MGQFDEFEERLAERPKGPPGDCGDHTVQAIDGTFFAAFSTQLAKKAPVVMLAEVTTAQGQVAMTLQPLAVADRRTPAGDAIDVAPTPIDAEGNVVLELRDVVLVSAANPITTDVIEAPTLTLTGTACADFICGGLSGQIAKPATITLSPELSTFTLERVDGDAFPEPPKIDCNGTLAKPLGG